MARCALSSLNEQCETLAQNLDSCTASPQSAELAKYDALTAATQLCSTTASILAKVVALQEYEPKNTPPRWPLVAEVYETE